MQLGSKSVNQFFPIALEKKERKKICERLFSSDGVYAFTFLFRCRHEHSEHEDLSKGFVVRLQPISSDWKWIAFHHKRYVFHNVRWASFFRAPSLSPTSIFSYFVVIIVVVVVVFQLDVSLFGFFFNSNSLLLLCWREFMHVDFFPHHFSTFYAFHNICNSFWCVCVCCWAFRW